MTTGHPWSLHSQLHSTQLFTYFVLSTVHYPMPLCLQMLENVAYMWLGFEDAEARMWMQVVVISDFSNDAWVEK